MPGSVGPQDIASRGASAANSVDGAFAVASDVAMGAMTIRLANCLPPNVELQFSASWDQHGNQRACLRCFERNPEPPERW